MSTDLLVEQHTFQLIVLLIGGVISVAQLLLGIILRGFSKNLQGITENLSTLNNMVLQNYVTKRELEAMEEYSHKHVHEHRDHLQHHEVVLNLLARHVKMDMPNRLL